MQIQLTSDRQSESCAPENAAPVELSEAQREMLDNFLSRLQSIIGRPPALALSLAEDTRPTGRTVRR